jgi:hypothetical protein
MFKKRRILTFVLTALLLAAGTIPIPTTSVAASDVTTAAPTMVAAPSMVTSPNAFTTEQTRWAGSGQVRVSGGFTFSGGRVYSAWRDCRVLWTAGNTRVDITWCGTWNNGSSNYMEIGANYTVRYVDWRGWEYFRYDGWMRTRVYASGRVEFYP